MANICTFQMLVIGKKENIITLNDWLDNKYVYVNDSKLTPSAAKIRNNEISKDYVLCYSSDDGMSHLYTNHPKHFIKVDSIECDTYEDLGDGVVKTTIYGSCKHSVGECMVSDATIVSSIDWAYELMKDHAVTIGQATKMLDLVVEIISCEPSEGFAEHYVINRGEQIVNKVCSYKTVSLYDYSEDELQFMTKEDIENMIDRDISVEEWEKSTFFEKCDINISFPEWTITIDDYYILNFD